MAEAPTGPEPNQDPESPLVLVPVTAEDAARRSRRIKISIASAALIVLATAAYLYKRSVDPLHAQESYDDGVRLLKVARYDQAILAFDRATTLKSDLADAYLMRARAYVGVAKTENAIRDFSRVIEMRPSDATAYVERALAYVEMKDYRAALADASQAVVCDPKRAQGYNVRGLIIRITGDPQKALDDFTRAVELAPNEDNYYQRGATYQALGEHRKAIADFDQVIAFKPDEAPGYFARAESRRAIGDVAGAKADHLQGRIIDGR
jgi:tetratricopeptide (TPR) repeat protein